MHVRSTCKARSGMQSKEFRVRADGPHAVRINVKRFEPQEYLARRIARGSPNRVVQHNKAKKKSKKECKKLRFVVVRLRRKSLLSLTKYAHNHSLPLIELMWRSRNDLPH
ncbi:hypothetical protein ANCCAN_12088 [Ancylostoma caninum]|uniref:Uncharacterized protein n=1 Tax=Ancylostoma caninum TaxID=29170 RepID=A0A368GC66_ANCCA|nr:hypothetical protein ANCCAN_12088 [Ancylostoma caninum]